MNFEAKIILLTSTKISQVSKSQTQDSIMTKLESFFKKLKLILKNPRYTVNALI